MKSEFICLVEIIDPDLGSDFPIILEVRKLANGALVGIDRAYLDHNNKVYSPYDREEIDMPKKKEEVPDELDKECVLTIEPNDTYVDYMLDLIVEHSVVYTQEDKNGMTDFQVPKPVAEFIVDAFKAKSYPIQMKKLGED